MYGGELQGFSRFSVGLEEMRYTCQYWKADYSVGGSMLSACLKEPTKHTGSLLGLFPRLVALLYSCVPLATVLLLLKAQMN